jgi:hypothetical protein
MQIQLTIMTPDTEYSVIVTTEVNISSVLRNRFDLFAAYLRINEINCPAYATAWTRVRVFQ